MIAGVDGCRGGWVIILEHEDGGRRQVKVNDFRQILGVPGLELVVIDVPIGLLDSAPRAADREARRFLRTRGCCVFPAPYRSVIAAETYAEACQRRERVDGKRMSQQAFGIMAKIREVDAVLTPELQHRFREGHPEVTFALMNGGVAVSSRKKTHHGFEERRKLLETSFGELRSNNRLHLPSGVGRDDLIDAYAMLWTARRVKQGINLRLPLEPQIDARGLRAEILA
jgi:predicted RNase H-like nuclease